MRTLADLETVRAWVEEGARGVFVIDAKISPDLEADWHAERFFRDRKGVRPLAKAVDLETQTMEARGSSPGQTRRV